MPGDLRDPENMLPFYYDQRYDTVTSPFDPGAPDVDGNLQSIAVEVMAAKLSPEKLADLKQILNAKGLLHRIPGDPSFRDAVKQVIRSMFRAGKVAQRHARSK
jgi:hypothetical protein